MAVFEEYYTARFFRKRCHKKLDKPDFRQRAVTIQRNLTAVKPHKSRHNYKERKNGTANEQVHDKTNTCEDSNQLRHQPIVSFRSSPEVIKLLSMLNATEHEILIAHTRKIGENKKIFLTDHAFTLLINTISEQIKFHAKLSEVILSSIGK